MNQSDKKGIVITDEIADNISKVEELAYELKINQVMTSNILIIQPETSMEEVSELFPCQKDFWCTSSKRWKFGWGSQH